MPSLLPPSRRRRVLLLGAIGFSSGIPYLLTSTTLSARLVAAGVDLTAIGLFALIQLPYSLKFLWAPLLDRFHLPLGRRRGWLVTTQVALMFSIVALGAVDPRARPGALAALALATALLSATQDVVADAFATDVLDDDERAAGGSIYVFGYRLAMLTSGAVAMLLADHVPWATAYGAMAALLAVGLAATLLSREPPIADTPRTLEQAITLPLADFFGRRGAVVALLFVMLYQLPDLVARGMITPLLLATGFTNTEIGAIVQGVGIAATIAGTLGGGALVARLGIVRSLLLFGILQALPNAGYSVIALAGKHRALLVAVVAVDNLCTGLVIATSVALLMSLCNKRFSATQYALLTSASGVLGRVAGAGAGLAASHLGFPLFFVLTIPLAFPALALLVYLARRGLLPNTSENR